MAGFQQNKVSVPRRIFGKAGSNKSKSDLTSKSAGTSPLCPQCGSRRVWKDGMRGTRLGPVQRWICRSCGYRFSDPKSRSRFQSSVQPIYKGGRGSTESNSSETSRHLQRILTKKLNSQPLTSNRQICATKTTEAINLAKVETRKERAAGATKPDLKTTKGLVVKFMAYLEREAYKGTEYFALIRRLANLGTNLLDPEDVKRIIAEQPWKDSVKMLAVYAYDAFAKMQNISWTKPRYKQKDSLPFVPEEKELDQLIASCKSQRMATFLQTLKETFADPGEALGLRWIDIKKTS
jgi:predicted RNA-binding Zn-ribbon protein involved in translation (DUF1610 family)